MEHHSLTLDEQRLIDRLISGDADSGDAAALQALFERHPDQRTWYDVQRDAVRARFRFGTPPDVADSFERLRSLMPHVDAASATQVVEPWGRVLGATRLFLAGGRHATNDLRRYGFGLMAGVAAIALMMVASVKMSSFFSAGADASQSHFYATARGQRTAVVLPDGSRVMLTPETQLRFSTDARGARQVDLTGEAFFSVAPQAHRPFIVRTGSVMTRVLGTNFDVRHYSNESETQVAVTSGRVEIGGQFTPVVLVAGAVGRMTDSSVVVSVNGNADGIASWTEGHLVFRDIPVATMLQALGRWYGYEFHLTDSTLAASHVWIGLNADQPSAALNTVKAVLGVTMTFDGNVVTLRPERTDSSTLKRNPPRETRVHSETEVGR